MLCREAQIVNELVIIVEGETEQTFVRDQLAAHLAMHNTSAWAVLPGRHRNHGGVKKWEVARQDIIRTLKEGRYCSTMFDYYAMPADWPGRTEAANKPWQERASTVESIILLDVTCSMSISFYKSISQSFATLSARCCKLARVWVRLDKTQNCPPRPKDTDEP